MTEKYLEELAKELNEKCIVQEDESGYVIKCEWTPDRLSFDYNKIYKRCYIYGKWTNKEEPEICESCNQVLIEKILLPYNKSNYELTCEINLLKKEIEELKKLLAPSRHEVNQ